MANQDLGGQLSALTQMKELLSEMPALFEKMRNSIGGQSDPLRQLAEESKEAFDQEGPKNMTDALAELAAGGRNMSKEAKVLGAQLALVGGALASAADGAKAFANTLGATVNIIGGVASSIFNLAKGAVGALVASYEGILGWAQDVAGQMDVVAQAMENIRGEFGNLASNEGAAVIAMSRNLRSDFAQTTGGMSIGAYAGTNLAFAFEKIQEIASELGPALNRLQDEFSENVGEVFALNQGFDISAQGLAGISDQAAQAGEDMTTALEETAVAVAHMSKQYGVSGKVIGKNLSKLTENMAQFGHMSRQELVATATYAAKLGVEVESLNGMFDKFANFEDAATGAAKLAETFGMNVDAMELMNAESPAEQMDMMRQAFMETGQSLDDLSRQEKAYLAEQMGLSDANDLYAMMDPSNADISYDDMIADAEAAQEAMSPEEAMMEAAKSIEKSIESMMEKSEGFFDSFAQGFMKGTEHSATFQEAAQAIRGALREVFKIGYDLAQALFGDDGVFGKNREATMNTLKGVLERIVGFFEILSEQVILLAKGMAGEEGGISFAEFADNMKGAIMDFFASEEVDNFGGMLLGALARGIDFVIGGLADLLSGLVDGLQSEGGATGEKMIPALGDGINNGLKDVVESLKSNFGKLIEPLGELIKMGLSFLVDTAISWATENPLAALGIFTALFGPAMLSGLTAFLFGLFKTVLSVALANPALVGPALSAISGAVGTAATAIGSAISAIAAPIGIAIGVVMTLFEMFETFTDLLSFLTDDTKTMGEKVGYYIGAMVDFALAPFKALLEVFDFLTFGIFDLSGGFDNLVQGMKDGLASFFDQFTPTFEAIYATMEEIFNWIKDFVMAVVIQPFIDLWNSLSETISYIWNGVLSPIFSAIGEIISIVFVQTWNAAVDTAKSGITSLGEFFTGLYDDYIEPIITPISEFITPLWEKLKQFLVDMGTWIMEVGSYFNPATWIQMAVDAINGFMSEFDLAGKVGDMAKGAVDSVKNFFGISSPSTVMAGFGGNVVEGFMGSVSAMPEAMLEELQRMIDFVWSKMEAIGQIFIDAITSYIDMWLSLPNKIIEFITLIHTKFLEFLPMISDMLQGAIDFMVEIMQTGMNFIVDAIMFLPTKFIEIVSMITETLFGVDIAAPFREGIEMVKGFLSDGIDFFMNTFSPAALGQIAVDALDGFLNMFSIGDALSAVFGDLPGIVKSVLGISSPSTVFAELGGNVTDGFSGSVEEMPAKMAEQMQQLIAVATENMMQMMNVIQTFMAHVLEAVMQMPEMFTTGLQEVLMRFFEFGPVLVESMQGMMEAMIDVLINGVGYILETFEEVVYNLASGFDDIAMRLEEIDLVTPLRSAIEEINEGFEFAVLFMQDSFAKMPGIAKMAGLAIVDGFMNGFNLAQSFEASTKGMWKSFVGFFGIRSPSKLMEDAAMNITEGFVGGTEGMDQALVGNTEKATALLAEVDKVNAGLNGLDAIEAESTVSKVAAGLAGDGTVTVQHEGLNIQVNFKVNIDSKDLAAALGDDAEGGPFFVINTSRGGADAGGAEAAGE